MLKQVKILTKMYDVPEGWTIRAYERAGGYQAAKKALGMSQSAVIDEVKKANIRGRGGAGFPAGV
jgi:NADH-quinone oxidoreductase subunit F